MTTLLLQGCRRCGAPVDVGRRAALAPPAPSLLIDAACEACGHRALYPARPVGHLPRC